MAERDSVGDPAQLRSDTGSIAARKGGSIVVERFPDTRHEARFSAIERRGIASSVEIGNLWVSRFFLIPILFDSSALDHLP
jgi:hypothetical protein